MSPRELGEFETKNRGPVGVGIGTIYNPTFHLNNKLLHTVRSMQIKNTTTKLRIMRNLRLYVLILKAFSDLTGSVGNQ